MKTYIYKAEKGSSIKGFNRTITVYRVKKNKPIMLKYNDRICTASSKGDRAVAWRMAAEVEDFKMCADGYFPSGAKERRLISV